MKGHIAFCPHFHQPHFQLYKTREEAYGNSYLPWLKLLQNAVSLDSFYINLHFSGPFLYWIRDQKKEYLEQLAELLSSGKVGIIGGLADEPFIQLSSRIDDYFYQLKQYDRLLQETIGVSAADWQGIHLVERECGESMLREVTRSATLLGAPPIYYLDVETFYEAHFSYPGSDSDYCQRHFGFNDPVSITTISHIPPEMLFFALRDEIAGQAFHVMPVHSQFRYQLLKRNSFAPGDSVKIKPGHYYFYIKDTLEKAYEQGKNYGRNLEPLVLIFEDAEKFGQWSKDPEGDGQWLMEFFELVDKDPDLQFTGLREYLQNQGYMDSYPVASSHSYTEWENWTAHRGIRGVTYGDERLRRVLCRLRDVEYLQQELEKAVLESFWQLELKLEAPLETILRRALLDSPERYEFICGLLDKQDSPAHLREDYKLLNRVRNLLYQEDPKWASRHPVYGSSPYYDVQGLAYLEMMIRIIKQELRGLKPEAALLPESRDWDFDGQDELVLENDTQTLVLDAEGGCISYYHVLAPSVYRDCDKMRSIVSQDLSRIAAYNSVFRYSYPLVFSETDSSISRMFYEEGGRREHCRNSLRCQILLEQGPEFIPLGDFDLGDYSLKARDDEDPAKEMSCSQSISIDGNSFAITIKKTFELEGEALKIGIKAWCNPVPEGYKLILVPQIVSTATPSDEIEFRPQAFLGVVAGPGEEGSELILQNLTVNEENGAEHYNQNAVIRRPQQLDYLFQIRSGNNDCFNNRIKFSLESDNPVPYINVRPAVSHYYKNYVFSEQSNLGYHSSGLMIKPGLGFRNGEAGCNIKIKWEFDSPVQLNEYEQVFCLVGEAKRW